MASDRSRLRRPRAGTVRAGAAAGYRPRRGDAGPGRLCDLRTPAPPARGRARARGDADGPGRGTIDRAGLPRGRHRLFRQYPWATERAVAAAGPPAPALT